MGIYEVEGNLSLLSPLETKPQPIPPGLFPSNEEKTRVEEFLEGAEISPQERLVSFAPGSFWPTKRWPQERFTNWGG